MKRFCGAVLAVLIVVLTQQCLRAEEPLTRSRGLQFPSTVKGNFDHLAIDLKGHRLFTTPEESKSVIVFDYESGKIVHVIEGIGVPHAVLYREDLNRIFITDGEPGAVHVFDGKTYQQLKSIKLLAHTDSITYDPDTKFLYVITGGKQAQQEVSTIAVIDTTSEKLIASIKVEGDALEAMAIDSGAGRLYVNNTGENRVDVIDLKNRKLVTSWPLKSGQRNTSLALDSSRHLLFVGCRSGVLVVLDTNSGKEVQSLPMTKGVDDMVFDSKSNRVYASCGDAQGAVEVYSLESGGQLRQVGHIISGHMGKTALLSTALHRYFVSVPSDGEHSAQVLVYEVR